MKIFTPKKIALIAGLSALVSLSINEEAPKAAEKAVSPKEQVVVAVIDTGAELDHELLKNHLWSNPGETGLDSQGRDKSSNGIDDDHNGFVDDVHGWNFIDGTKDISDHHGHGTHIAGIIAGPLPEEAPVRLMILKYFDSKVSEQKTLEASNKALAYALSMGADIVNYSGGGNFPNPTERSLVQKLDEKGIYLVAASGNDGRSLDAQGFYPASYGFPHILSVASTDASGRLLPSSNRGKNTVDLAALGFEVFSSLPDQRMGTMTGTSQATAEVTSVLASLMAHSPLLSADQMKKRLLLTARPVETLEGQIKNPLIPDRKRALSMRDEDEFDAQYRLARTRVQEVFDDPLQEGEIQREISSDP